MHAFSSFSTQHVLSSPASIFPYKYLYFPPFFPSKAFKILSIFFIKFIPCSSYVHKHPYPQDMKSMKTCFVLAVLMALAITLISATTSEEEAATSLRGTSGFLPRKSQKYNPRPVIVKTCDKYPSVCLAKGSAGPHCCQKKCVNLTTDRLNCGRCGKKCNYSKICCQGKCVSPMSNEKHCGRCGNKCKKGSSCVYGMCSYA